MISHKFRNIVIIGGTGFIGRHVALQLLAGGYDIVSFSRGLRKFDGKSQIKYVTWDISVSPLPPELISNCDAIINCLGIARESGSQTFERAHVAVVKNLIEAANDAGIKRFIQISVSSSRPDIANPYVDTKWRSEQLVANSGLDFTILRPGIVFGPGDEFLTTLIKLIKFSPIFPMPGDGNASLQIVDIHDVAKAVIATLAQIDTIGRSYDIVGTEELTFRDILHRISRGLSLRLYDVPTPLAFSKVGAQVLGLFFPDLPLAPYQLAMLVDGVSGDPVPASIGLGIVPQPLTTELIAHMGKTLKPYLGVSLRLF